MASIGINVAMHKACSSPHLTNKESSQLGTTPSFRTKKTHPKNKIRTTMESELVTVQKLVASNLMMSDGNMGRGI